MSIITESIQEISNASKETEKQKNQIYSNVYFPAMRKNRKHLRTIVQRLENSQEIIRNIRKKFNSRSTQFSFDLRNVREFQWMSMKERSLFFEDDLKINSVSDAAFFKFQLELYVDSKRKELYQIHPIFYTGSTWEIAQFVRKVFYRENISNIQKVLNNIDSIKYSRNVINEQFVPNRSPYNFIGKTFDEWFKYLHDISLDDMEKMYHQTLISQLKKYSAKIEENYGK